MGSHLRKILDVIADYNRLVGFNSIFLITIGISCMIACVALFGIELPLGAFIALWSILIINALLLFLDPLLMDRYLKDLMAVRRKAGLPVDSLKGMKAIEDMVKYEFKYALAIFIMALVSFLMFLAGIKWLILFLHLSMIVMLSLLAFTSVGQRKYYYGPSEVIRAYEPEITPMVLNSIVYDFLDYALDPLTRLKLDEYKRFLDERRKLDFSVGDILSKTFLLVYLNEQGAIRIEDVRSELGEVLKKPTYVGDVELHPDLGFERLKMLMERGRRLVKPFFILLDRLFIDIYDNLREFKNRELYADFESDRNVNLGSTCHVLVLLYNNLPYDRKVRVSFRAEGFEPASGTFLVELPKRDFDLPEEDRIPIYDKAAPDTGDVVGLVSRVLDNTRAIWLPLVASDAGTKNVVVVVEDEDGKMLCGESFRVNVRRSITSVLRTSLGYAGPGAGVITYLLQLLLS